MYSGEYAGSVAFPWELSKITNMQLTACVLSLCQLASTAMASRQEGIITLFAVSGGPGEPIYLLEVGQRTTKPVCAVNADIRTISNPGLDAAKAVISLVLAAKSSNQRIRVIDTGTCDAVQPGCETGAYMVIQ